MQDKNAPKFANPSAQALVGSSKYWNTEGLKVRSSTIDIIERATYNSFVQEPGSIKDEEVIKEWIEGYQVEAQKVHNKVSLQEIALQCCSFIYFYFFIQ